MGRLQPEVSGVWRRGRLHPREDASAGRPNVVAALFSLGSSLRPAAWIALSESMGGLCPQLLHRVHGAGASYRRYGSTFRRVSRRRMVGQGFQRGQAGAGPLLTTLELARKFAADSARSLKSNS